jgi:hypothetical protein
MIIAACDRIQFSVLYTYNMSGSMSLAMHLSLFIAMKMDSDMDFYIDMNMALVSADFWVDFTMPNIGREKNSSTRPPAVVNLQREAKLTKSHPLHSFVRLIVPLNHILNSIYFNLTLPLNKWIFIPNRIS